ncbi:MAG: hypothetical protein NVS2B16_28470 [Chloroflexota bacterium]
MPLELPPPDENPLARSPLALTVCQIRFEQAGPEIEPSTISKIYESLGGRAGPYPRIEQTVDQTVNVIAGETAPGTIVPEQHRGWRLASSDGSWTVRVMPHQVTLETTRYDTWEHDFKQRFLRALEAVDSHLTPTFEQRLGLRYVNRITEPQVTEPHQWEGFIVPELLGPILHGQLGPAVAASQQQLDLNVDAEVSCGMRHGFFRDAARNGAPTYLLDYDVYRQELRAFDITDVASAIDRFNRLALQLFHVSVTPKMLALLKNFDA